MSTHRHCRHEDGAIVCGGALTDDDRHELARFKRYLRGEMPPGEVREYAGLSLGQAAKILGVTREALAEIERVGATDDALFRKRFENMVDGKVRWEASS